MKNLIIAASITIATVLTLGSQAQAGTLRVGNTLELNKVNSQTFSNLNSYTVRCGKENTMSYIEEMKNVSENLKIKDGTGVDLGTKSIETATYTGSVSQGVSSFETKENRNTNQQLYSSGFEQNMDSLVTTSY
jgi:hypothetical protein